jgi:hypothetical protein
MMSDMLKVPAAFIFIEMFHTFLQFLPIHSSTVILFNLLVTNLEINWHFFKYTKINLK